MGIDAVNQTSVILVNIVCDNASSNVSMLNNLGANISDHNNLKVTLDITNILGQPVLVILDISHLIKLIRNCLGELKVLFTSTGEAIKWQKIQSLHKLQALQGYHLGNRLRREHVEYHKKKMRVYLAIQVISDSVADSLEYCENNLDDPEFKDSKPTAQFLRVFNKAFDRLDSKFPFAKGSKAPLRKTNQDKWMEDFDSVKTYILDLHHVNPTEPCTEPKIKRFKSDTRVIAGPRKRTFLGFLVNMESFKVIFRQYVEERTLMDYLLCHKSSQDFLEATFGAIRSSLGCNNNPTVPQFTTALKKILLGARHYGKNENCTYNDFLVFQTSSVSKIPTDTKTSITMFEEQFDLNDEYSPTNLYLQSLAGTTQFKSDILNYISGYITRKVQLKEQCVYCSLYLRNLKIRSCGGLILQKNRGGLTTPPTSIEKVVKVADSVLNNTLEQATSLYAIHNLMEIIYVKTNRIINDLYPTLFNEVDDHVEIGGSHKNILVKKIVACFVTLKSHHITKSVNKSEISIRVQSSKLILFKNQ